MSTPTRIQNAKKSIDVNWRWASYKPGYRIDLEEQVDIPDMENYSRELEITPLWWKDSRAIAYNSHLYAQNGHQQVLRNTCWHQNVHRNMPRFCMSYGQFYFQTQNVYVLGQGNSKWFSNSDMWILYKVLATFRSTQRGHLLMIDAHVTIPIHLPLFKSMT